MRCHSVGCGTENQTRSVTESATRSLAAAHIAPSRQLTLCVFSPIITVTVKAFWDIGHAPKDQSNRRSHLPDYAAWEIYPMMRLGKSINERQKVQPPGSVSAAFSR